MQSAHFRVSTAALSRVLEIQNDVALEFEKASGVVLARRFVDIETSPPGSIVVLEPALCESIGDYRFDIALRNATALAGVVWPSGSWPSPSLTSQRIAEADAIAFGELVAGQDALSLTVALHELRSRSAGSFSFAIDRACQLIDSCTDATDIEHTLGLCSLQLGAELRLADAPGPDHSMELRTPGAVPSHLHLEATEHDAQTRPAAAYLARRIESLLHADFDRNELPAVTRAELLNEVLLTDAATSADAISRLRDADFPVDGSHVALRIDCHAPLPEPTSASIVHRCQASIAHVVSTQLQLLGGVWTRAGTASSILMISSQREIHADRSLTRASDAVDVALRELIGHFPDLSVHIGIGTPHLGAGGLRTSVSEATTSVRTAKTQGRSNDPQHFDRLGLGRALVRWAEIDGVRPVIDEIMAPLLDQTPRQARQAVRTLRAYLDSGQNVAKTAEELHIHRNTVRYRIDRIAAVLPVSLDDPDDRLLVELSCRVVHAGLLE